MEEKQILKKQMTRIGAIYFLFAVLSFAAQLLIIKLVEIVAPDLFDNTAMSLIISMLPLYCIATPVCIWMLKKIPAASPEKHRMKPVHFLAAFVMTFAGMYLGNFIGLALSTIISAIKGSPVSNSVVDLITGTDMWGTVLVAVIIAPIVEEWLFRKLLIDRIIPYGEGVAVVLSGLMFGLFHGNINQFFYAFFIGMMFAFIYVKTGNVWYSVLMHMIINFFGSVVAMLVINSVDLEGIEALSTLDPSNMDAMTEQLMAVLPSLVLYMVYVLFLLGMMLAGVILFALNRRKFVLSAGQSALSRKEKKQAIISSWGMLLYFIFWFVMMILQIFA